MVHPMKVQSQGALPAFITNKKISADRNFTKGCEFLGDHHWRLPTKFLHSTHFFLFFGALGVLGRPADYRPISGKRRTRLSTSETGPDYRLVPFSRLLTLAASLAVAHKYGKASWFARASNYAEFTKSLPPGEFMLGNNTGR